jgi:hypothetical protein
MKTVAEFIDFENDEEATRLTVHVVNSPDIGAYVKLLEGLGFIFDYIDGDSCEAELEGEYEKVFDVMRRLEQEGFTW